MRNANQPGIWRPGLEKPECNTPERFRKNLKNRCPITINVTGRAIMLNNKTQKPVANHQILFDGTTGCTYLQSYDSIVCMVDSVGRIFLNRDIHNCSKTTAKYRNMFLKCTTEQLNKQIANGTIKVISFDPIFVHEVTK